MASWPSELWTWCDGAASGESPFTLETRRCTSAEFAIPDVAPTQPRILVVDDDRKTAEFVALHLRHARHSVFVEYDDAAAAGSGLRGPVHRIGGRQEEASLCAGLPTSWIDDQYVED